MECDHVYPPPVNDAHPIWIVLNSIEIRLPFVHPSIIWADSSITAIWIIFCVGIVKVRPVIHCVLYLPGLQNFWFYLFFALSTDLRFSGFPPLSHTSSASGLLSHAPSHILPLSCAFCHFCYMTTVHTARLELDGRRWWLVLSGIPDRQPDGVRAAGSWHLVGVSRNGTGSRSWWSWSRVFHLDGMMLCGQWFLPQKGDCSS